jgi:signal transduction histidine kinase
MAPGMTSEAQKKLFKPFFTAKHGTGMGIGLWVTKCLVEQHGGYTRFRSRQGQHAGTVISFFLPSPHLRGKCNWVITVVAHCRPCAASSC